MDIDQYYKQHETLLSQGVELKNRIGSDDLKHSPQAAFEALSNLSAHLVVHLAMEDSVLYPHLLASVDPKVQEKVKNFQNEMGGIVQVFLDYVERWSDINAIRRKPDTFKEETGAIYGALGQRVAKENEGLYPLVNSI